MKRSLFFLVALWIVAGCGTKTEFTSPDLHMPLAIVEEDTITLADFQRHIAETTQKDVDLTDPLQRQALLNDLIYRRLIYREGMSTGLDKNTSVVLATETKADEFMYQEVIKKMVYSPLITDAEMEQFYNQLKNETRASHILISHLGSRAGSADQRSTRTRQDAERLIDSIHAALEADGSLFNKLAFDYSDDMATKFVDGDLGYIRPGELPEVVENVIFDLGNEGISEPVSTARGFHIFKMTGKRSMDLPPLADIRQQIAESVIANRVRRQDAVFSNARRSVLDSLLKASKFQPLHSTIDFFLSRYRTLDHAHEVVELFDKKESETPIATFDGGSIQIGELVSAMSGNQRILGLNHAIIVSGLAHVAEIRIVADLGRQKGIPLNPSQMRSVNERRIDEMAKVAFQNIYQTLSVDDEKVKSHYEGNIDHYRQPFLLNVAEIRAPDEKRLGVYFEQLQKKKPFEEVFELAKADEKMQTRITGLVSSAEYPDLAARCQVLKSGEVSTPFPSNGGFAIIRLIERKPGEIIPFENIKEQVRHDAIHFYRQVMKDDWLNGLARKYKVVRFEDNMKSVFDLRLK